MVLAVGAPLRAQSNPQPTSTVTVVTAVATAEESIPAPTPTIDLGAVFVEPVLHGAWLWQANCVRCHGAYGEDRVGEELKQKDLSDKISGADSPGCSIDWALARGGPLTIAEIRDIAAYIEVWEEGGREPDLAPLLPVPPPTLRPTATLDATSEPPQATPTPAIDPAIAALLAESPIYAGAWLYAENCVICHLGYERARQSSTLDDATVRSAIANGKVATIMPKFGILNGGNLRSAQVDAIVTYMRTWENLGREPDLPAPIAEHLAQRATIAEALPTMVGAPLSFAPTATPTAAALQANTSRTGASNDQLRVFLMLTAMGLVAGAGLFVGAVACTAIHPPKPPTGQSRGQPN
jgi:mono/diheme cytochrome c family protein